MPFLPNVYNSATTHDRALRRRWERRRGATCGRLGRNASAAEHRTIYPQRESLRQRDVTRPNTRIAHSLHHFRDRRSFPRTLRNANYSVPHGNDPIPAGGEVHENEIQARSRCLHISGDTASLRATRQQSRCPRKPAEISGLSTTWLANRLYAEFSRQDTASEMAIEGLVLEILAEIARSEAADHSTVGPALAEARH